ncbi:MAG: ferredoxin [Chloroflexi bacterium ADurb.Bin325]|nr:MAG: ferredoxin [Chloroflexi bacterium ADurb.Bin325]
MAKVRRQIITIDEEKCDGCGNCVPACVEGALQVIDGKARLVKESYCDGLGACLGDCPQGALHVVELEVESYDEPAVLNYLAQTTPHLVERHIEHLAAHGMTSVARPAVAATIPLCSVPPVRAAEPPVLTDASAPGPRVRSELRQWPVQLHLIPPTASFLQGANLTLIADCVPFANPNMHADLMADTVIAVGCPKLDDSRAYIQKLTEILQRSDVRSLRVAYMEVPCCRGMVFIAQQALQASGKDIPLETILVNIEV